MLKKIVPQVLSAAIVGILTSGLIVKFQPRIEALTKMQTFVISIALLALAAIVLAIPSLIIGFNQSPEAKANLVAWGFLFLHSTERWAGYDVLDDERECT